MTTRVRVLNNFSIREISGCARPVQKGAEVKLVKAFNNGETEMENTLGINIDKAMDDAVTNYIAPVVQELENLRAQTALEKAVEDLGDGGIAYLNAITDSDRLTEDEKTDLATSFILADPQEQDNAVSHFMQASGYGQEEQVEEVSEVGKSQPITAEHQDLMNRMAEVEQRASQAEYEADIMKSAESIESQFPNLPGTPYDKALVFKSIDEGIQDPHVRGYLEAMLRGANEAYGIAMVPAGASEFMKAQNGGEEEMTDLQKAVNEELANDFNYNQ